MKNRPAVDHRVVLLGASNLMIGLPILVSYLRAGFEGSLDVFAALGHGRSYGTGSFIPGRWLPAILDCRLWDDLAAAPVPRRGTHVLVTDVGNDLLYGKTPETILDWVEECLVRAGTDGAEFVLTRLPMARVERLAAWHFHAVASVFFPFSRLRWSTVLSRARELDAGLVTLAEKHGAAIVAPPMEWYGFDPIHIRQPLRRAAWRRILGAWPSLRFDAASLPPRPIGRLWWLSLRPAERLLILFRQTRRQPALDVAGLRLHLY